MKNINMMRFFCLFLNVFFLKIYILFITRLNRLKKKKKKKTTPSKLKVHDRKLYMDVTGNEGLNGGGYSVISNL
jgi:hypothetical protein